MDPKKLLALSKTIDILYCEDDISFNKETSEIFKDFFNNVDVAFDGKEALQKYKNYFSQTNIPT